MTQKSNVLIAEDDASYAANLRAILQDEGYKVQVVDNGNDAVDVINKADFDLGFIDINMPGKTGLEIIEEASRLHPELPLIILTAFGSVDYAVKAMQLGAFDFIEKDTTIERILVSARNALKNKRLAIENKWMRRDYKRTICYCRRQSIIKKYFSNN